jgi:hypothetical protein
MAKLRLYICILIHQNRPRAKDEELKLNDEILLIKNISLMNPYVTSQWFEDVLLSLGLINHSVKNLDKLLLCRNIHPKVCELKKLNL